MNRLLLGAVAIVFAGCGASAAPAPASTTGAPSALAPLGASIGAASALPTGATISGELGCPGEAYVGPFEFHAEGESLTVAPRIRSVGGAQACVGGSWVDGNGTFIAIAEGFGCPEGSAQAGTETVYNYRPSSGESGANPIYLRISTDANACAPAAITLTRR